MSPSVVNGTGLTHIRNMMFGTAAEEGTGSGFVYDDRGHIVTNYHVVEGMDELMVTLPDGTEYEAEIVGLDEGNDLAVLRIDAGDDLPPALTLADSDELRVGQFMLAIGRPFGLDQTVTTGVVSALERVIESPNDQGYISGAIQTDAAINPGNPGGLLLSLDGRVVGINSQVLSTSGDSAGIGFVVSSDTIHRVVADRIATGRFAHPWIGVETIDVNSYVAAIHEQARYELAVVYGVLVVDFERNSSAEEAGERGATRALRYGGYTIPVGGDIVIAIDGYATETLDD